MDRAEQQLFGNEPVDIKKPPKPLTGKPLYTKLCKLLSKGRWPVDSINFKSEDDELVRKIKQHPDYAKVPQPAVIVCVRDTWCREHNLSLTHTGRAVQNLLRCTMEYTKNNNIKDCHVHRFTVSHNQRKLSLTVMSRPFMQARRTVATGLAEKQTRIIVAACPKCKKACFIQCSCTED